MIAASRDGFKGSALTSATSLQDAIDIMLSWVRAGQTAMPGAGSQRPSMTRINWSFNLASAIFASLRQLAVVAA
jgi:hypothetical protein